MYIFISIMFCGAMLGYLARHKKSIQKTNYGKHPKLAY